ncbi:MAG: nucleoside triphosphate pyrophosphohydrolase [Patescibacteria group bacterium]
MKYHKLIRDKIPQLIKRNGGVPIVHIATQKEYWLKLKEKLQEEIAEFNEDESVEEMADILEVLEAMCKHKKFNKRKLASVKAKKLKERGGFKKKIILEES